MLCAPRRSAGRSASRAADHADVPVARPGRLVPLPTKWTLHVGEPVDVAGRYAARAADATPRPCRGLREQVRERSRGW